MSGECTAVERTLLSRFGRVMRDDVITDAIFDLDDTLCDFRMARERGIAEALALLPGECRRTAAEIWRRQEPQLFAAFAAKRISRREYRWQRFHLVLAELALGPGAAHEERELITAMNRAFMREINVGVTATDGAHACLAALGGQGVRCHLLTNGPSDSQRLRLKRLGLDAFLERVFVAEEIGTFKPDPAAFRIAVESIGQPPGRIVMIGDDLEADILPALGAGLRAIHFAPAGSGFRPNVRHLREILPEIASL